METVRSMDLYEQCALSVCSKATESLVNCLKMKNISLKVNSNYKLSIAIKDKITLTAVHLIFSDDEMDSGLTTPNGPFFILVETGNLSHHRKICWKQSRKFNSIIEWIKHFMDLFCLPKIERLFIAAQYTTFNCVKECIKGFTIMQLYINPHTHQHVMPNESYLSYSNHFLPRTQLTIIKSNVAVSLINPRILNQNIPMFIGNSNYAITLNHLLLANSEYMELSGNHLSTKDINRFLKLWISGCNPRMKCLILYTPPQNHLNNMKIFEGIIFNPIPDDVRREYPEFNEEIARYKGKIIKGGYDILRSDETVATVHFGLQGLEIFVWDQ